MNQNGESMAGHADKITNTICELKSPNEKLDNSGSSDHRDYEWVSKNVSSLKGRPVDIRCPHCLGPIRLHFRGEGHRVIEDHFEHLGKRAGTTDRYTCRAGSGFKGTHQESLHPIK